MGKFLEYSQLRFNTNSISWFRDYYRMYADYAHINLICRLCNVEIPKLTTYIQTWPNMQNTSLGYNSPILCEGCAKEAAELNGMKIDYDKINYGLRINERFKQI